MTTKIIYRGLSLLDDAPIIVLAKDDSTNRKTGMMMQTYIIREDVEPSEANRTGKDFSICGTCEHRGTASEAKTEGLAVSRSCYVEMRGITAMYKAYKKGRYKDISASPDAVADYAKGRKVRLGAYGDGAVVPSRVWDNLLKYSTGHTGYTHQANQPRADVRRDLYMISTDSLKQSLTAWAGKERARTFRVITEGDQIQPNEIICPATPESPNGIKTTCYDCRLCDGVTARTNNAPSIVVFVHGSAGKVNFINRVKRRTVC
jgi:hypothetical protein